MYKKFNRTLFYNSEPATQFEKLDAESRKDKLKKVYNLMKIKNLKYHVDDVFLYMKHSSSYKKENNSLMFAFPVTYIKYLLCDAADIKELKFRTTEFLKEGNGIYQGQKFSDVYHETYRKRHKSILTMLINEGKMHRKESIYAYHQDYDICFKLYTHNVQSKMVYAIGDFVHAHTLLRGSPHLDMVKRFLVDTPIEKVDYIHDENFKLYKRYHEKNILYRLYNSCPGTKDLANISADNVEIRDAFTKLIIGDLKGAVEDV